MSRHCPAASGDPGSATLPVNGTGIEAPSVPGPSRVINALALVKVKVERRLPVAGEPMLHTRTPTGKSLGPLAGVLLSSPIVLHVICWMVRVGAASARRGHAPASPAATITASVTTTRIRRYAFGILITSLSPKTKTGQKSSDSRQASQQEAP